MSNQPRKTLLTKAEVQAAFCGEWTLRFPPILGTDLVAEMLGLSKSTIYDWLQKGRFEGAFRKRGKHMLFWRDKVIEIIFNGKDW